jgi:glycosyltransferase involved in cell wall biosynthesis
MRVWLLHIGEDLPVDGPARQYRYTYLANALLNAGHRVLRWAPTFRHNTKTQRFAIDTRVEPAKNYEIQFVSSPGYRRNISFARLRAYRVLGRRFRQLAKQECPPDLIVAAIPSLEWAEAAVDYGRQHSIPVVVDVRDLWPEVFANALPAAARPLGRLLLTPYYRRAARACRKATALTAVSQGYMDWAIDLAGRRRDPRDLVVPLGFEQMPREALHANIEKLRQRGIDPSRPICLFVGLFERSYDLETVIDAARRLMNSGRSDVQFVLCGDGSKMPKLKRQAADMPSVHFLGWVDATMLEAVASISTIGVCAYATDALQSLPNKPFEYMAHGLAVASSLSGEMAQLLTHHQCGLTYPAGNAAALAECLVGLLTDQRLLASLRSNAFQTWSNNFRSSGLYARFVDHLETLVDGAEPATKAMPSRIQAA